MALNKVFRYLRAIFSPKTTYEWELALRDPNSLIYKEYMSLIQSEAIKEADILEFKIQAVSQTLSEEEKEDIAARYDAYMKQAEEEKLKQNEILIEAKLQAEKALINQIVSGHSTEQAVVELNQLLNSFAAEHEQLEEKQTQLVDKINKHEDNYKTAIHDQVDLFVKALASQPSAALTDQYGPLTESETNLQHALQNNLKDPEKLRTILTPASPYQQFKVNPDLVKTIESLNDNLTHQEQVFRNKNIMDGAMAQIRLGAHLVSENNLEHSDNFSKKVKLASVVKTVMFTNDIKHFKKYSKSLSEDRELLAEQKIGYFLCKEEKDLGLKLAVNEHIQSMLTNERDALQEKLNQGLAASKSTSPKPRGPGQ